MKHEELDHLIDELEGYVGETEPQKGYWKLLWNSVSEIGQGFRSTYYPEKSQKDEAWKRFQDLVDRAKARSEEIKERTRQRTDHSAAVRSMIVEKTFGAVPVSPLAGVIADAILLPLTIVGKTVDHILSSLLGLETKSDLDLMREQLLACNEQMKKAWGAFEEHKLELIPADKAKAYEALREAQDKLNEAWAHFKGVSTRVYESRKQEWEEKQRNFKARITANIEKNEAALEKARSALERQEANLESNREKLESARGDAYRERLEGWIEEGETLIESIKQNIERTEGWLSEDRAKLDQM